MDEASDAHDSRDYRACPIRERPSPLGHTVAVSSSLSTIPVATRRAGAVGLAGFALLSTVVGVLAIIDGHAALVTVGALAVLAAAVIALAAWGMWQSVRLDVATARLDTAVAGVLADHRDALPCGCGHDHDPEEMHVQTGVDCAQDGAGTACSHTCQTCVLTAHRSP
jgi:ABC-type nickel/cobalt efflux system permease component RcnA